MYYVTKFCCTCLKKADQLISIASDELRCIRDFELCLFNFIFQNVDTDQPLFVCTSCCKYLKTTCKFVEICRINCATFRSYIGQLRSVSEELPNEYYDITVEISDSDKEKCVTFASQVSEHVNYSEKTDTTGNSSISAGKTRKDSVSEAAAVDKTNEECGTNTSFSANTNFKVKGSIRTENKGVAQCTFAEENRYPLISERKGENAPIDLEIGGTDVPDLRDYKAAYSEITNTTFTFETFAEMQRNAEALASDNSPASAPAPYPRLLRAEQDTSSAGILPKPSKTKAARSRAKFGGSQTSASAAAAKGRQESKMVRCRYCKKQVSKRTYRRHLFTHFDIKPYKCETCITTFVRRDQLQRHASQTHSMAWPGRLSIDQSAIARRNRIALNLQESGVIW